MLLNKHNLDVANFCSKRESGYTLQAVEVSEQGTTATDGHILVNVTLPSVKTANFPDIEGFTRCEKPEKFLLPKETAVKIARAMPTKEPIPILNHVAVGEPGENTLSLAVTDLDQTQIFRPRKTTGQFPNWQAIMPAGEPVFEIALDLDYLAALAKGAGTFNGNDKPCALLRFYGPDKAMLMQTVNQETGQKWSAVLMPLMLERVKDDIYPKVKAKPDEPKEQASEAPVGESTEESSETVESVGE